MKLISLPKLDLNVTNKCNFRCIHCAFDSGIIKMKELSLKKITEILKETKELGGKRFDITGGEPLLRKDIEKIIKIGKKLDYKIELVTNGSLLNKTRLKKFKRLGLDSIAISLDGSTPEIYNKIRKKDRKTFYKIVKNIKESKRLGFYTKINTAVFNCNLNDIPAITELALKFNVNEHGIYYFTPIGRGTRTEEMSVEPLKWLRFIRKNSSAHIKKNIRITMEFPLIEKNSWNRNLGCIANKEKSHLQILPDGNVYPCAILASYNLPVANLHKCSIKNLWNNELLWKKYWEKIHPIFKKYNGSCVNFRSSFNVENYRKKGYCFVCPLRKFELGRQNEH